MYIMDKHWQYTSLRFTIMLPYSVQTGSRLQDCPSGLAAAVALVHSCGKGSAAEQLWDHVTSHTRRGQLTVYPVLQGNNHINEK